MQLAYNPTDQLQLCSIDGRQIAGGATAEVDPDDEVAAAAIAAGLLTLWEPEPKPKPKPRS